MYKNTAGQYAYAQLIATADGSSVTSGTTTVYQTVTNSSHASIGTATHAGNGAWYIDVTQAETNYDDFALTWVNSSAIAVTQTYHTTAYTVAKAAYLDASINDVLTDTAVIGALGAGLTGIPWNAAWDAEVQSEVDDALIAKGLDHLVFTSVAGTDIADNSIIAKMVSKSATADWDSFTNTTDALEALRDNQIAATDIVSAGAITTLAGAVVNVDLVDACTLTTTTTTVTNQVTANVTAISGDATAADNAELFFDNTGFVASNSTIGTVTTYTGNTPQTGDSFARIGAAGASLTAVPWNAAWDTEVESEVDDALIAKGLDHLVFASVAGTDIADNSIIAKIVSKSATADWDSFANTTDSMEALRDNQIAATDIVSAGAITTSSGAVSTVTTVGTVNALANDSVSAAALKADAGTEIGTAVWATAARTLTAATNITSTGNAVNLHTDDKVLLAGTTHTSAVIPTVTTTTTATNVTTVNGIGSNVITAASLNADAATEVADAVWATAARTLTAPTNITSNGAAITLHTDNKVLLAGTTHTSAVIPSVTTVTTTTTATNLTNNNDKTGYSISGVKTTLDALNDVSTAQVNTEVDTALADINLDHLMKTAAVTGDITNNSVIARLVSKSATAAFTSYDNTSDSLEAIRDRGDAAWLSDGTTPADVWAYATRTVSAPTNITSTGAAIQLHSDNKVLLAGTTHTSAVVPTVTTLTGHTAQTGDTFALANGANGFAAIKGETASILTDTAEIGAAGIGLTAVPWNSAWDTEVQSEVDDALIAKGLDHLVFTSVAGTDIADNSIIAKLASKSATADWDDYVNTTDSLQAIHDAQLTAANVNTEVDTAISDWATTAIASASTMASHTAYSPHFILLKLLKHLSRNKIQSELSGSTRKEVVYDDDGVTVINSRILKGGADRDKNITAADTDITQIQANTV